MPTSPLVKFLSVRCIKNAILTRCITGIELNIDLKPEFYKPCAKAKSAKFPFSQKSGTCAEKYGEKVHWDLWEPASV